MVFPRKIGKPSRNDSKIILTIELKNALTEKMRLMVWGYTNGEYQWRVHLFLYISNLPARTRDEN